jgi:pyruvate dehydrogenase E2 component (dihydrolipoamide acetyltransferase)
MASDVTMPRLSDSMEEGTVLKWLVEEGGEVTRGEPLVEIETDKANMTYDADTDGVLIEIVAQEGDTLEIGEVIARIGDAGEAKSSGEAEEGDEEEAEGGGEEGAEAEAEAEGGEEEGGEEEGGEEEGAEEEQEAAVAEGEREETRAEGDEAEGEEQGEADDEADAKAEGGEEAEEEGGEETAEGDETKAEEDQGEDEGGEEAAAAEGEEAAVAGAEGGGGETQAGAGTATREKTSDGNGDGRVKASPVARRMARDLGVELAQLEGTGPGGRIVKADVQAAAENGGGATKEAPEKGEAEVAEEPAGDGAKAEAPAKEKKDKKAKKADKAKDEKTAKAKDEKADDQKPDEDKPAKKEPQKAEAGPKGDVQIEELTRLQQTVSRRMAESKATAPDFSIALTVDMTAAVALRARLKEISDPVPAFNDMVVKASANALREHPRVNGAYRDGKFELYDHVNVGIAVAAMDALVVPTVFDADKKSLGQIARDARAVIGKVKDKTVTPPELSGGTFTVSNLGMFGIEQFTAIINPPQAAILTVGKLEKQPAVDDKGKIIARDQMVLTLVCDHRILYGADGAQFLARVKELLEQPLSLAL